MTTFEACKNIRRMIINRTAEVMVYDWDDKFAANFIREFPEKLKNQENIGFFFNIQPSDLTAGEMVDLGFSKWSNDDDMMLIPLWLFPFIADKITVGCIDGKESTLNKSDVDTDNRCGCLAYGVQPKK